MRFYHQEDRTIVHFDLDSFFVSVERLQNPKLNGLPIIIGGTSDRGVVSTCSYEARAFGVHSAMPMKMAMRLCKDAIIVRGDMDEYSKYSRLVTEIIADKAPLYEKASIDEHYLDISGMDRFFGSYKWTKELRQSIINETGLPISFGLSVNKTVAKIATGESKPNGELQVLAPQVKPFMFPLSIRKIPMLGKKTFHLLRSMGVSTIETLSRIPPDMMEQVLGKNGLMLWKRANGIDNSQVEHYSEQKSMSSERTFEQDTTDVIRLRLLMRSMAEKLAFELRKKQKMAGCVAVKIRYSNFDTHTQQKRIPYTSFDHVLMDIVSELFEKLYSRRMLIRLVGVRLSDLVSGVQQLDLFEDTPEMISLYNAMDKVRLRFGKHAIKRGSALVYKDFFKREDDKVVQILK